MHHSWPQINRPSKILGDGTSEARPVIVMDSWMDGPAVRLKDADVGTITNTTRVRETFDKERGLRDMEDVDRARQDASPGGALHSRTEELLEHYTRNPPQSNLEFHSMPVIAASFAADARVALKTESAMTLDLMAVAAGRSAYNLNVLEATANRTSDEIVVEAMDLENPSRPPIVRREDPVS